MVRTIAVLCFFSVWPVSAQECNSWQQVSAHLKNYGQILAARAPTDGGNLMGIFVNPATDTWTVVRQVPLGCTAVLSQGIGWRWLSEKRPRS